MEAFETEALENVESYLARQENKDILRFLTCGAIDDGKSTLLGRMLFDSKLVLEDQILAVHSESRKFGTRNGEMDLALLVDGLQAEWEQGITIDVAYRYFSTDRRKFIAADTPGHEQYTRNMATGASTADLAVVLVDARKGVLTQTRRHSFIAALLGIRHVVLAVNKMDLVEFNRDAFDTIVKDYHDFAAKLGLENILAVPLSALTGENVIESRGAMPWYDGPSLLGILETIEVGRNETAKPFRMPVQWVNRPNPDFHGFSGTIATGGISVGDSVMVCPAQTRSQVDRIVTATGDKSNARAGQAVTLVLSDEIDVSRGDLLCETDAPPSHADQFSAHVIWMNREPLLPERPYVIRFTTRTATAQITDLRYKIDVNTLDKLATKTLKLNEVGYCNIAVSTDIAFDSYADNRHTGCFVLIDKFSNATLGAGMIDFPLRRASNITWYQMKVSKEIRANQKKQKPCVLWFTGLSGAGKSTIADRLEQRLQEMSHHTYLLDGDNVRHGLNKDLGFTDQDRVENIRRVTEVARLMVDAGLIVITSFISPFRSERRMARELIGKDEFLELFVDTSLEICESRDPKGLYRKARSGELKNFTGIDSEYEIPDRADITLQAGNQGVEELVDQIIKSLEKSEYI